ncbi:UPF2 regulator of nonsense mediated mRNA decay isoform X2 [Tachypleus tridentatus]|uniref:UPF2 regulator of nonsense mediated mRNA decay isoform X2 n=1 Tax=Tachypleus tridentatus TaxID=6853 RepID=UPI003FD4BE16
MSDQEVFINLTCEPKGEDTEKKPEVRGKSWKREREERGRRQQNQQQQQQQEDSSNCETEIESSDKHALEEPVILVEEKRGWGDGWKKLEDSVQHKPSSQDIEEGDELKEQQMLQDTETDGGREEESKHLEAFIVETSERLRRKAELRTANSNIAANRPEDSFFSKLDSSLKKNTAFVKRLKNLTEAQRDSLIKDMNGLNLTKYISEAAAAIVEAKLKMSDLNTAVQICSLLHQRYSEFSTQLLENWQKVLPMKKDEKITNPSKIRVDLRFYSELISCGVFTLKEGLPLLGNLLTILTATDKEEHNNINILLSFCKHCGEDYAGLVPQKMRILAEKHGLEIPKSDLLPPDRQKGLRNLLKDYYRSLCRHVVKDQKTLHNMEQHNRRILQTKGELSAERKEKFEAAQLAFQKLLSSTQQFSDIIDEDLPELPREDVSSQDPDVANLDVHNRFKDGEFEGTTSLWEDDDTRSFYENIPDLKAFIPGILFKDSAQAPILKSQLEPMDAGLEEELSKLELDEVEALELEEEKLEDSDTKSETSSKQDEKDLTETILQDVDESDENSGIVATNKMILDGFLFSLLNCVNREMIDQAAVDFCMNLNTKPNRKKLVRTLFLVPRTRLDLLPFYARFVATLNPCMPDVSNDLVTLLKQDFKFHIKKKDQINIESKVKTVRFIGELTKFNIYPKSESLYCLKMLLFDFTHHHIEMACNLLETCGRFLFRSLDSHQRTKVYLSQMMRKKSVMAIDSRYATMVENAFYYCNPPEAPITVKVERLPIQEYLRKLLYKDLSKNNTEKILRQMRKLNWDDSDISAYATKCLVSIWNVKYYNVRCVANLLAGLVAYQENVGPQVVDGVLEDIRLGMEINHPKYNQRRVSMVRYLGELYNYRMVESAVIFRTLYSFITFGVSYDDTYSELDSPDNLFRIRLVCILLETCGQYFNSGSSKKKLDCFLVFFQRYYWHKKSSDIFSEEHPFPVTLEFLVKDTIQVLRPKFKLADSQEEAVQAVEDLLRELKPKLVEILPSLRNTTEEVDQTEESGLGPIEEEEEDQDDDCQSLDGSDQEQDMDGDTDLYSGSQSQPNEEGGPIEVDDMSTSEDEGEESIKEGDDALVTDIPRVVPCPEDDDFMTAFDRILSESMLQRNQESVKPQTDIVIPMNIRGGNKKVQTIPTAFLEPKVEEQKNTINFVLMTRKGNKQQFKSLEVPLMSDLAQNLKDREKAERAEKEQVKKLTLDINERQEEEDYQEMLAAQQRPAVLNLNRDRRHRYQHPKGAPDADLIFGNKKR